jgi:hypothetical protein
MNRVALRRALLKNFLGEASQFEKKRKAYEKILNDDLTKLVARFGEEAVNAFIPRQINAPTSKPRKKPKAKKVGRKRRKAKKTAKSTESSKIQGQYLGLLNKLPKGKRSRFRSIQKKNGREAAIKAMEAALK